jgi:hypothetical protein
MTWLGILLAAGACFAFKYAGLSIPPRWLASPALQRVALLLPIALLAALVAVQTVSDGPRLVVDARLAGLGAGVVALLLRAPFLVVVAVAATVAAALRALT